MVEKGAALPTRDDPELRALVALRCVRGLGDISLARLLRRHGSARAVWEAAASGVPMEGVRRGAAAALARGPDEGAVEELLDRVEALGAWLLYWGGPGYPPSLAGLEHPPPLLYCQGDPRLLHEEGMVAMVGARRATSYGRRVARELAMALARAGVATVSGFAVGIDGAAHAGSLEGGGATVAVLGCGLDLDYPRSHRRLRRRVAEQGLLLSEFDPGTPPDPGNFPKRNRIISGLARAVVVVEADMKSGSLITASHALEQGKEVYAVPGSIYSPVSRGTHWLIRQGAPLISSPLELLEELRLASPGGSPSPAEAGMGGGIGPREERVLACLEAYPLHIDEIAARAGLSASEVGRILVNLELDDMVTALPGHMYQRC